MDYADNVGKRFGIGSLFAFGSLLVTSFIINSVALRFPPIRPFVPTITIFGPLIGFFISGAVGGASLGMGRNVAVGFGIGFSILGPIFIFIFMERLKLTENEMTGVSALLGGFVNAVAYAIYFGVAGAIGSAFMRKGLRFVLTNMKMFAFAGAFGGAITWIPILSFWVWVLGLIVDRNSAFAAGHVLMMFIGLVIVYALSGVALGGAVNRLHGVDADASG